MRSKEAEAVSLEALGEAGRKKLIRGVICYRLEMCIPPNFVCGTLAPKVTVFGGGASGS